MDYLGYYINLDRSPERRVHMEGELARVNLAHAYQRFSAADGNTLGIQAPHLSSGAIGCWLSHYLLLKQNLNSGQHLHVVEDDALFASCTEQVIRWAIHSGFLDKCDILFTDVSVPLLNDVYKTYRAFYDKTVQRDAAGNIANVNFQIIDLSRLPFASTNSFLVNKSSVRKLHDLFEQKLHTNPDMPIDLFIRDQSHAGVLKSACVFPFVTSPRLESSMLSVIQPDDNRRLKIAAAIGRYALFVGCDWGLCQDYLDRYVPLPEDRLTQVLGRLLTHSITDNHRFF